MEEESKDKYENKINNLYDEWNSLILKIKDIKPFVESDYKNGNLDETDKVKNYKLLEKQKKLLESLWIDVSNIKNNYDLIKSIKLLVEKYETKIWLIEKKNIKEIWIKDKNNYQIGKIELLISEIKIELNSSIKILEEEVVKQKEVEKEYFTKSDYFLWEGRNYKENKNYWRDENVWSNYSINNVSREKFGFWDKNEIKFSKENFLIEWLEWEYNIPQQIKLGYSNSENSNSEQYIWNLKSVYNKSNEKLEVFYYEELKERTKVQKINIPSWYKTVTNQIHFSGKNISYNIVEWDLWMTYLLFEPELKENVKIKVWLIKNNVWNTTKINTLKDKSKVWNKLDKINRDFLDKIDKKLLITEKVILIKEYIMSNSYYVAWWIDLKNKKDTVWSVENMDLKYLKNWKRPLICNLANNQFSAYLNYLWINTAYISWLSHWWYWEYSWHWWIRYFDWYEWLEADATPSEDSSSDLKKEFSNENIWDIIKQKYEVNLKINKENKSLKILEKQNIKLQNKIDKNNSEINSLQNKVLDLEKILTPERNENIGQVLKNSENFEKVMTDFWINFLKNIDKLKQEQNIVDPNNKTSWITMLYDARLINKMDIQKLKLFNKKLNNFLRNSIEVITSALNNEKIDFWTQYAYLVSLTGLLNNFKGEIFAIDQNLSKKLDVIKNKIKNESLFLDEIKSFPELSYISMWENVLIKKWKFELSVTNLNNINTVYKNWEEEHIWIYEKWDIEKFYQLWKDWLKEMEVNYWDYMWKDWKIIWKEYIINHDLLPKEIKDYPNNNFTYEKSINNRFLKYSFYIPTEHFAKHILFDVYNKKIYKDNEFGFEWEFVWYRKTIWNNMLLFSGKQEWELLIKDNNFNVIETLENVKGYTSYWKYLVIERKWKTEKYLSESMKYVSDKNKILYEVTDNWLKEKETPFLFRENNINRELITTIKEYLFFQKDFLWNSNEYLNNNNIQFFENKDNIKKILKKHNFERKDIKNIWDIIQWEDWYKYTTIEVNDKFYFFRNDWKLIYQTMFHNYILEKIDEDWNLFFDFWNWWHEILSKFWKEYSYNHGYNMEKVSYYDNLDWNKIEYQALYTEEEYIKELNGLLERKNIDISDSNYIKLLDDKDIDFIINRFWDFKLDYKLTKIYDELLINGIINK